MIGFGESRNLGKTRGENVLEETMPKTQRLIKIMYQQVEM